MGSGALSWRKKELTLPTRCAERRTKPIQLKWESANASAYREAPVSRRLFAEKEASPKTKQGRSSDKPAAESTKAWVVKSFGEKPAELDRETERRNPKGAKEDNPKKSNFKTASWYRDPSVEVKKAASDPGKTTSRKSLSNDKRPSKLAAEGKETSSVGSQALMNPTDVEEVISPLKDLMKNKRDETIGDDRGGRRGKPVKSCLGPCT